MQQKNKISSMTEHYNIAESRTFVPCNVKIHLVTSKVVIEVGL